MASPLSALLKLIGNPAIGAYESLRLVQNSVDGPNIYWKDNLCPISFIPYADILQQNWKSVSALFKDSMS